MAVARARQRPIIAIPINRQNQKQSIKSISIGKFKHQAIVRTLSIIDQTTNKECSLTNYNPKKGQNIKPTDTTIPINVQDQKHVVGTISVEYQNTKAFSSFCSNEFHLKGVRTIY